MPAAHPAEGKPERRLRRDLKLVDVYAISTGAMFSSGFFLLPGIAFAQAGAWVVLAYALSALIAVPALLSKAELASALPRAGGTYYFLDRSMGPLIGTVGGMGTWISMGLKNTFALIGIGAYLALFFDVDITAAALVAAAGFTVINIVGVKETARLQRYFVYAMLGILGMWVLAGIGSMASDNIIDTARRRFGDAPDSSLEGVLATVGLVFVSYAGLTKVASVAEEVENPGRNILRGMVLSLATAVVLYTAGTFVLVMVVDHDVLRNDLAPIATAAEQIFNWMPGRVGVILIVVAAFAAFASTANAGILAASRYLLAMGRDRIISDAFRKVGKFHTPTLGVLTSGAFIVVALLTLDVVSVAKLASAFQLLMFALVNIAVIVMRESQIETYHPPVRSPFYPWTQLAGAFASFSLILLLGPLSILFTFGLVGVGVAWYFWFAKERVSRRGAILHWFERLGRDRNDDFAREIWSILKETGLREDDPLIDVIERAHIIDVHESVSFSALAERVAERVADHTDLDANTIAHRFEGGAGVGLVPVAHGVALPHLRIASLERHQLVAVRAHQWVPIADHVPADDDDPSAQALFFLLSPDEDPGQHLRILAALATQLERPGFLVDWTSQSGPEQLHLLLRRGAMQELAERLGMRATGKQAPGWHPRAASGRVESILVVDADPAREGVALDLAQRIASTDRAELTLADFAQAPSATTEVETKLETLAEPARDRGLEVTTTVLQGRPWLETIRQVVRANHDLVMVGARRARGGRLDSFVKHLLRKCPCPVWLAPSEYSAHPRRILATVDAAAADAAHKSVNIQILDLATSISEQLNAELHVLYVCRADSSETRDVHQRNLDTLLRSYGLGKKQAQVHLLDGDPSSVIPDFATENDIELVVMGTVCRTDVAGVVIGTTAENLLEELQCAVVGVKPAGFVTPIELDSTRRPDQLAALVNALPLH